MTISHTTRSASFDEVVKEMDRRGHVIEALEAQIAALATPSPQPVDAVRVKLLEWVKHPTADIWRSETMIGVYQVAAVTAPTWQLDGVLLSSGVVRAFGRAETSEAAKEAAQDDYARRIRAALASDPALAGEAADGFVYRDETGMPQFQKMTAPEDTARLREDLERVTRERDSAHHAMQILSGTVDVRQRERDDTRKALETVRAALKAWDDCPDHAFPSTVMEKAACLAEAVRAAFAARSASREGASDE